MTILIKDPGFVTTVQDLGCYGYAHLGISPAGAADSLSFRIANLLTGNDDNAPALEMTLLAPMTLLSASGSPSTTLSAVTFMSQWLDLPATTLPLYVEAMTVTREVALSISMPR